MCHLNQYFCNSNNNDDDYEGIRGVDVLRNCAVQIDIFLPTYVLAYLTRTVVSVPVRVNSDVDTIQPRNKGNESEGHYLPRQPRFTAASRFEKRQRDPRDRLICGYTLDSNCGLRAAWTHLSRLTPSTANKSLRETDRLYIPRIVIDLTSRDAERRYSV